MPEYITGMTDTAKHSPLWQGLRPTGKTLPNGQPEPGDKPLIVNCKQQNPENCHEQAREHQPTSPPTHCPGLCAACTTDFRMVLADVPLLLDDLDIAIAGETRFVEHGTRNGSTPTTTGGNQAIAAAQRLAAAIMKAAGWFDAAAPELVARGLLIHLDKLASLPPIRTIALDISSAVSRAHKIIDAPPELWFYGACPEGHDIWQERIGPDSETPVKCRVLSCGYTSDLTSHHKRLLDAGNDRWMTIDELVGAISSGGITITREQIKGWIYRDGLPRERRTRPRWVDGELKPNEVWVYRLGDVRDYALRVEAKRNRVPA